MLLENLGLLLDLFNIFDPSLTPPIVFLGCCWSSPSFLIGTIQEHVPRLMSSSVKLLGLAADEAKEYF